MRRTAWCARRSMAGIGVLVLALVSPVLAQYDEAIVTGVQVEGIEQTSQAAVQQLIRHEVGQPFDRAMAQEDLEEILLTFGTYRTEPELSYYSLKDTGEENMKILVYHFTENPEVMGIEVTGNTVVPEETIVQEISKYIAIGHIYNMTQLGEVGQAVRGVYTDAGYMAEVDDTQFDWDTGMLSVSVLEMYVGGIEVEGLDKTDENTVLRELKTEVGDLVEIDTILRDLDRLRNLDIFEVVLPEFEEGVEMGEIILVIRVVEKKTGTLSLGVGYSNRDGLVGFVEYLERNLGGEAKQLAARAEIGSIHVYDITYFDPWLDNDHTSLEVSLYDKSQRRGTASVAVVGSGEFLSLESRTGGQIAVSHPLNWEETQRISARYRYERVVNQDPRLVNIISPALRRGTVGSLALRWSRDDRDYIYDPSHGGRIDVGVEQAGGFLGGEHTFTRFEAEATRFFEVGARGRIALRGSYGTIAGSVPIFETFAMGGAESLRGYREDRFFGTNQF
ncbi:MAG: BamA/TamA family outer membrane protein, partial [Armatimonadia bacterium]|nr:BamA/TamA family outer membrane protein [Armatimonadia bacterium]